MFADRDAVGLLTKLLSFPGLSGHEAAIATFIKSELRKAGVPASAMSHDTANRRSPIGGDIGNLVILMPGTRKAPRRLLMAHLDTVPLCAGAKPVLRGKKIVPASSSTALGGDNRTGVAAVLNAALTLLKKKLPHPPLTLFFPVQEEVGLFGARFADVKKLGKPALCFNWDSSTPNKLVIGATGAHRLHIDIRGHASHAGVNPHKGASAIAMAGLAIADLQRNGWHGLVKKGSKTGTSNIGIVQGGEATNVVTDCVSIKAEARSHDAAFRAKIVAEYKKAFERAAKQVKSVDGLYGSVSFRADVHYEAFRIREDAPCVVEAKNALRGLKLEPITQITNGGLDANWMTAHGLPTVSLGAGQREVHTVHEHVDLNDFLLGCRAALALATGA